MTLSVEVVYGQSTRAFQVVEKTEQIDEEVSQEDDRQTKEDEQAEDRVRSALPRSGIGARDDSTHARACSHGNNDWRAHSKSRTLGELATHLARLPGFGILMAMRSEFDGLAPRPPEPEFATSAERVRMFDELSTQLRAILQQMTWNQANTPWKLRLGDKVVLDAPRVQVIRTVFVTHSAHHRAQLGVYLRMLETPVPWSYGRSADEEPPAI